MIVICAPLSMNAFRGKPFTSVLTYLRGAVAGADIHELESLRGPARPQQAATHTCADSQHADRGEGLRVVLQCKLKVLHHVLLLDRLLQPSLQEQRTTKSISTTMLMLVNSMATAVPATTAAKELWQSKYEAKNSGRLFTSPTHPPTPGLQG